MSAATQQAIQADLVANPQNAVNTVVSHIMGGPGRLPPELNISYQTGPENGRGVRVNTPASAYAQAIHTVPAQANGQPEPVSIEVYPNAMSDVGMLHSAIQHELIHAGQYQNDSTVATNDPARPMFGKANDPKKYVGYAQEIETHAWEVRNADQTGISQDFLENRAQTVANLLRSMKPKQNSSAQHFATFAKAKAMAIEAFKALKAKGANLAKYPAGAKRTYDILAHAGLTAADLSDAASAVGPSAAAAAASVRAIKAPASSARKAKAPAAAAAAAAADTADDEPEDL